MKDEWRAMFKEIKNESEPSSMIRILNPATHEMVGETGTCDPNSLPSMRRKASEAQTIWNGLDLSERKKVISRAQDIIFDQIESIAEIVCQETGKTKMEAINADIGCALSAGDFSMGEMKRIFRPYKIDFGSMGIAMRYLRRTSYIVPKPIGVVGIIAPWNYPFGMPYSQTVMAIAAGNAVLLKPSSHTPFSALKIAQILEQAGVPKGLVQVVVGRGEKIGQAFAWCGLDRIIFTGGKEAGRKVMENVCHRFTPVTLELGGKDPFLVMDDADIERAAEAASWGAFVNSGQTCCSVKRFYVQSGAYSEFTQCLVERVRSLKLGWGWEDPEVSVGPMISEEALVEMEEWVSIAEADGGRVLCGGKRSPTLKGNFFEPTVIAGLPQSSKVIQEEIFGPIVSLSQFHDEEEGIALANDCQYALTGSVWTKDLALGRKMAESMSGGTILVNNVSYTYGLSSTPWGGRRQSGFGHTHGILGFAELLEPHHVHVDRGKFDRELWWYPYDKGKLEANRIMLDMSFGKNKAWSLLSLPKLKKIWKGK
ncbi:MAG TPA: aldehyde dehydrogenase family protein [Methanomassiliicoccales archaeon]